MFLFLFHKNVYRVYIGLTINKTQSFVRANTTGKHFPFIAPFLFCDFAPIYFDTFYSGCNAFWLWHVPE